MGVNKKFDGVAEVDKNASNGMPSSVQMNPFGAHLVEVRHLNAIEAEEDWVAEEIPVALVYNGISHAVMMTTPSLLEEFAVGFSLSEGIVPDMSHIYDINVTPACKGMEVNLEISSECFWHLKEHRRSMTGRTGCGLCGVESLDGAIRKNHRVEHTQTFDMRFYEQGLAYLEKVEELGQLTGCTHAAVWVHPDGTLAGGAEDVGRHVALDKLLGMRAKNHWENGALFVSSRASYEMVQKATTCGVEIMFAVSAPTALAVRLAKESGMTLSAFCRHQKANVYAHPERLLGL
ncbi:MAG: formate dehydrogenase accessory sulfurtransferase FdhD [Sutterella wadsworthensis]|nr:formate dehydrogenase accessory sulfurtransferase FdhD [Sutterella wadsworthensis]